MTDVRAVAERIQQESSFLRDVIREVESVIVGQKSLLDGMLIGLLADGHVLLEGVPGLAKTLAVHSLATALGGTFRRLQFTPDLLPSDLVGTQVYNPKTGDWTVREGPVFGNFVLADEINRAPAKVQSALLEAMQEHQVTLAGETRPLPAPFLVLATQNPIEQEGTYPLPEAQVDRFMLKVVVGYPSKDEEKKIIERMATTGKKPVARKIANPSQVIAARNLLDSVYVDEKVVGYVVDLVFATRQPKDAGLADLEKLILYGASPRASIALTQAARAHAFLDGRGFVTPQDVKSVGMDVLRHRVITTYEAEAEGLTSVQVIQRVFDNVRVP
ncbi:MAG: MoxR family ATPase [Planctomycetes bacterium]|nr:MoxR family ATPase [Planctomycetota bacterium]MBI3845173.1 MoxR family ATPase [Planctomycetota bacterium]